MTLFCRAFSFPAGDVVESILLNHTAALVDYLSITGHLQFITGLRREPVLDFLWYPHHR